jgi:lysophospholipase L1-like esterase
MHARKAVRRLFALLIILGPLAAWAAGAEYIQERGGAPLAFRKFFDSQKTNAYTKITFFGGAITEGAGASKPDLCYRSLLMKHLRQEFPGATVAENNSAVAGTGSWLGVFRTVTDALYGGAALVIVEFAVDDSGAPEPQVLAAMEGIVRQIIARDSSTDIVFLYTLSKDHVDAYRQGKLPDVVAWHEKIAEHYGIPSVNVGQYAAEKILRNELTFEEFFKDGILPTDKGYALYFEALKPFVARCKAAAQEAGTPPRHKMPKALGPAPMDKAQCVPYDWAKLDAGWKVGQRSPVARFMHVLECEQPGAALTLRFKGAQVGYFDVAGPDTGDLEYSIDGGPWKPQPNFDAAAQAAPRPHARPIAAGLDPAQPHELRLRVAEQKPAASQGRMARIGWLLVDGEAEDPFRGLDPLQRIDAIYARMEPVKYEPPADRRRNLDATMRRLRDGPALKIVMLGDSIMGDTSSSRYELLLERMYPKCKVEKITSLRGSTGCWYYKLDNHVEDYVLKHKPDLLMIGGISQREDTDSIREVIRQVRARQSPEILLLTPAFGATPDRHIKEWTFDIKSDPADYRNRLRRLADEEKCGFIDMTGPWWRYVQDSGKDYGWFQRDRVHANDRGFQILGRILEKFFGP